MVVWWKDHLSKCIALSLSSYAIHEKQRRWSRALWEEILSSAQDGAQFPIGIPNWDKCLAVPTSWYTVLRLTEHVRIVALGSGSHAHFGRTVVALSQTVSKCVTRVRKTVSDACGAGHVPIRVMIARMRTSSAHCATPSNTRVFRSRPWQR